MNTCSILNYWGPVPQHPPQVYAYDVRSLCFDSQLVLNHTELRRLTLAFVN